VPLKWRKELHLKKILWNLYVGPVPLWKWLYINWNIIGKMNYMCIYVDQGSGSPPHNNVQDIGWNTGLVDYEIISSESAFSQCSLYTLLGVVTECVTTVDSRLTTYTKQIQDVETRTWKFASRFIISCIFWQFALRHGLIIWILHFYCWWYFIKYAYQDIMLIFCCLLNVYMLIEKSLCTDWYCKQF
jgi:hypothetical protein